MHNELQIILDVLNTAYKEDPAAMTTLVCNRVPCAKALADVPVVPGAGTFPAISMMGIIHRICLALTGKTGAVIISGPDADGQHSVDGFCEYKPPTGDAGTEDTRPQPGNPTWEQEREKFLDTLEDMLPQHSMACIARYPDGSFVFDSTHRDGAPNAVVTEKSCRCSPSIKAVRDQLAEHRLSRKGYQPMPDQDNAT